MSPDEKTELMDEMEMKIPREQGSGSRGSGSKRTLRKVSPLGMRILVRIKRDSDQTDSGLYLPEGAKEERQESLLGEVIEVASAIDDETAEEANISGIPLGELVLIPKDIGIEVPWDENLRLVETVDVLAIVDEVTVV